MSDNLPIDVILDDLIKANADLMAENEELKAKLDGRPVITAPIEPVQTVYNEKPVPPVSHSNTPQNDIDFMYKFTWDPTRDPKELASELFMAFESYRQQSQLMELQDVNLRLPFNHQPQPTPQSKFDYYLPPQSPDRTLFYLAVLMIAAIAAITITVQVAKNWPAITKFFGF